MVHQHFMLIPVMTVAENIVLGVEPTQSISSWTSARAEKRVRELSDALSDWPSIRRALVSDITVGQEQRVEILKALYRGADILILDEPTAVLTPQEAHELFAIIQQPQGGREVDHLHQPQAERSARDRRPDHGAAPRQEDRDGSARRSDRGNRSRTRWLVAMSSCASRRRPPQPGDVLLSVEDLHVRRRARHREGARRLVRGAGGRDRGTRRCRRKRPVGVHRRNHGTCQDPERQDSRSRDESFKDCVRAQDARCGRRAHSRGPPTARPGARVLDRGKHRVARLRPKPPTQRMGLAVPQAARSNARGSLIREFDVRGGGRSRRPGGCRAETSRRSSPRARSTRSEDPHRGSADPRSRRRSNRVSPPAARHRA